MLQLQQHCKPTFWPNDATKENDVIGFFVTKGISYEDIHVVNNENIMSDPSPNMIVRNNKEKRLLSQAD